MTQAEPAYQFAPIDVITALGAALTSMTHRFSDAGLEMHADLHPIPLLVYGAERRLQQLFSNLLENETRYTDRGGALPDSVQREHGPTMLVLDDRRPSGTGAHPAAPSARPSSTGTNGPRA